MAGHLKLTLVAARSAWRFTAPTLLGISLAVAWSATPIDAAPVQKKRTTRPAPRPTPKPDAVASLVGALSLNTVQPGQDLFVACEGSSFQALAWGLHGIKDRIAVAKGEYETEAEFSERRRKLEEALNQVGRVVVCQPLDDNEDAPFSYDADREVFRGTFNTRQNVWRDVKRTGSYVSKTRMGVRANVSSSVQIEYDVDMAAAFRSASPACLQGSHRDYAYEVPIARALAPGLKASGYLVFAGRLVSPFYETSDSPGSPTLNDPRDVYERTMTVHFAPTLVAVVGPGDSKHWVCEIDTG